MYIQYNNKLYNSKIIVLSDLFIGMWKDDLKDGPGVMKYQNNDIYQGQFLGDHKAGFGVYYYQSSQCFYVGSF